MLLQQPPTINEEWLNTTMIDNTKTIIRDFFENQEYFNHLEQLWFERLETESKLYKAIKALHDDPPCLGSDIWLYEERIGKPPGFEIFINSMVYSFEIEDQYPKWNDHRKKHLGKYWIEPYDINYHEKYTYTKEQLREHYKNYEKNQEHIRQQIRDLPITQELLASLQQSLINENLWDKIIEAKDVETFNTILKAFSQHAHKNITLDTIKQPRKVELTLPEYDSHLFCISFP